MTLTPATIVPVTIAATPARRIWRQTVAVDQHGVTVDCRVRGASGVTLLTVERGGRGFNAYFEVTPEADPVEPTTFHFAVVRTGSPVPTGGTYKTTLKITDEWGVRRTCHIYAVPEPVE